MADRLTCLLDDCASYESVTLMGSWGPWRLHGRRDRALFGPDVYLGHVLYTDADVWFQRVSGRGIATTAHKG